MNPPPDTPPRITLQRDRPAVLEAERAGVDIDSLERNLNLTYEQRLCQHNRALARIREHKLDHLLDADDILIDQNLRITFCSKDNLVLTLEDYLKAKKALGRENDRFTAEELRAIAIARAKAEAK